VFALKEENEEFVRELKDKKHVVNEHVAEILTRQAELDALINEMFQLKRQLTT